MNAIALIRAPAINHLAFTFFQPAPAVCSVHVSLAGDRNQLTLCIPLSTSERQIQHAREDAFRVFILTASVEGMTRKGSSIPLIVSTTRSISTSWLATHQT
ncbi:hypothetical protein BKA82DRAFT_427502 [Pisolithus tinctorius]|uniref:Uncharacterized protein n=1 Tax=Pisolithus tinctorius Marx 270 TaxID=870435 RepID=A0A0C3KBP0_PISTI|nr:hypothetical protein BKA82DRAFT_427502 [Pisolithus tinctorius]KIO07062.1 hypothetical protein M404DRAFT_427502 [Pisolithus tinctorius Marx 270]